MTLGVVIGAVLVWLWGTRMAYRWDTELHSGKGFFIGCFIVWWLVIPVWLPAYLKRRNSSCEIPRWVVGESGWHRRERLEREHKERAKEVEMPD
jgi:hypothetical protein